MQGFYCTTGFPSRELTGEKYHVNAPSTVQEEIPLVLDSQWYCQSGSVRVHVMTSESGIIAEWRWWWWCVAWCVAWCWCGIDSTNGYITCSLLCFSLVLNFLTEFRPPVHLCRPLVISVMSRQTLSIQITFMFCFVFTSLFSQLCASCFIDLFCVSVISLSVSPVFPCPSFPLQVFVHLIYWEWNCVCTLFSSFRVNFGPSRFVLFERDLLFVLLHLCLNLFLHFFFVRESWVVL